MTRKIPTYSLTILAFLAVLLVLAAAFRFDLQYAWTAITWGDANYDDPINRPTLALRPTSGTPLTRKIDRTYALTGLPFAGLERTVNEGLFEEFLEQEDTTSFMVVRDGTILYEFYGNGASQATLHPAWSVTKSFVATIVGATLRSGQLASINDEIAKYVEELEHEELGEVRVRDLMSMTSGVHIDQSARTPWSDVAYGYYTEDMRSFAMAAERRNEPSTKFNYNDANPALIAITLERATGKPIDQLFQDEIWSKVEAVGPATLFVDTMTNKFPFVGGALSAQTEDLARLGILYLRNGQWGGTTVFDPSWTTTATQVATTDPELLSSIDVSSTWGLRLKGYKYFWWIPQSEATRGDYIAIGNFGQYVYVSPSNNTVVVRTGKSWGEFPNQDWVDLIAQIARG